MSEKYLAIIPARGGSKRIRGKNIKLFLGEPIIKYSIDVAVKSNCFDEIMVSTKDQEIAKIAESFGAKVPFLRSKETSDDFSTTVEVIHEVLKEYKKRKMEFEYFCCIYPTAPFITPERLIKAMKILKETNADSVLPVVRFSYPIQRALKIENGFLKMFWPENENKRSQDLEPAYHDTGQFYWMKTSSFFTQKRIFAVKTIPMELSDSEVQDIDDQEDWKMAEIKYKIVKNRILL